MKWILGALLITGVIVSWVLFLAIIAGFLFRAYWVPWLWLGRSREVARQ